MFDDASKGAYAIGTITSAGETWTFSDALIGNLAGDLKISGSSVRIRNGYIQTEFSITDIAHIMFYAGTYGSDSTTTVNFQLSTDKTTWITVDSFTTTGTLELYSYIFDDTLTTSLGIDTSNAYYLRIQSETTSRTNVDNLQIYTGEGFIADDTPLYTLTFTDMVNQYLLNETVDLSGCVATHTNTGDTTCDITGTVDSSIAGVYEVIFSKTDEYGNTAVEIVRITVIDPVNVDINMDMIAYYDDAEGLFGDDLIDALNIILNNGFTGVTYGEARYILDESDVDPSNPNNLILVYLRTSVSGVWDCDPSCTWNREHVWPQSLLGEGADNGTVNVASDLYNLMPANPGENSSRSNQPYSALLLGYEPHDDIKGDVARALFYMMVMYENLNLVNTAPGLYEMGYLDELLTWHIGDPVDDFELNRQEVIASYQNNRNPFVDYPHLVDLIWYYTTD
jgi:endonuclease I